MYRARLNAFFSSKKKTTTSRETKYADDVGAGDLIFFSLVLLSLAFLAHKHQACSRKDLAGKMLMMYNHTHAEQATKIYTDEENICRKGL